MNNISEKTSKKVRLIYSWVFAAFTVVVGALFIWQVLDVYLGGAASGQTSPFTYEIVSSRVGGVLAAPFWIWIASIAVGFIVWEVFPVKEKLAPITDARYVLKRLNKRMPSTAPEGEEASFNYVKSQQKYLRIVHWLLFAIVAVYLVYVIVYVCVPSNFPNLDKTGEMLNAAKYLLPMAAVVYAAACIYVIMFNISAKNQLPHVKKLTAKVKAPQSVAVNKFTYIVTHKYFILGVRIAVACLGVAFVIAGCLNGSVIEVFNKAIRICTECIGLG